MYARSVLMVVMMLFAAACTRPAAVPLPEEPAAPGTAAPERYPVQAPLWGAPGTVTQAGPLEDGRRYDLSRSYAPLIYKGTELQPVNWHGNTYFFRQSGDEVWVMGRVSFQNGLLLYDEPTLAYRLPITVGAEWTLHEDFSIAPSVPFTYRVVGFETLETPAGSFEAVVLEKSSSVDSAPEREWWVPGVGMVKSSGSGLQAGEVVRGAPEPPPIVRQIGETTAILTGDGVVDWHGRELLRIPEAEKAYKAGIAWFESAAPVPMVVHHLFSPGAPHYTYRFFAYQPSSGTFAPVVWQFPDGLEVTALTDDFEVQAGDGSVLVRQESRYPFRDVAFEWSAGAMKAVWSELP